MLWCCACIVSWYWALIVCPWVDSCLITLMPQLWGLWCCTCIESKLCSWLLIWWFADVCLPWCLSSILCDVLPAAWYGLDAGCCAINWLSDAAHAWCHGLVSDSLSVNWFVADYLDALALRIVILHMCWVKALQPLIHWCLLALKFQLYALWGLYCTVTWPRRRWLCHQLTSAWLLWCLCSTCCVDAHALCHGLGSDSWSLDWLVSDYFDAPALRIVILYMHRVRTLQLASDLLIHWCLLDLLLPLYTLWCLACTVTWPRRRWLCHQLTSAWMLWCLCSRCCDAAHALCHSLGSDSWSVNWFVSE